MDRLDKQYLIAKQGHCFGQLGVDANLQCSDARQGHNSRIHAKGQEKDCQKITFRNPSSKGGRLHRVPLQLDGGWTGWAATLRHSGKSLLHVLAWFLRDPKTVQSKDAN